MDTATKRAKAAAEERERREAAAQPDIADALRLAYDQLGRWRRCNDRRCRRHHGCRGDVHACGTADHKRGWTWLHHALQAVRAGQRPRAAMRAADVAVRPKMRTITFRWRVGKAYKMRVPVQD